MHSSVSDHNISTEQHAHAHVRTHRRMHSMVSRSSTRLLESRSDTKVDQKLEYTTCARSARIGKVLTLRSIEFCSARTSVPVLDADPYCRSSLHGKHARVFDSGRQGHLRNRRSMMLSEQRAQRRDMQ
jgi:hypothetical protein